MGAIVCVADLLLDSPLDEGASRVLEGAARRARACDASAFVSCGNLFDGELVSLASLELLRRLFAELAPMPVLVIPGEHDAPVEFSPFDEGWVRLAGLPDLAEVARVTARDEAAETLGVASELLQPPPRAEGAFAPRVGSLHDGDVTWTAPPELPEAEIGRPAHLELPATANGRCLAIALEGVSAQVTALLGELIAELPDGSPSSASGRQPTDGVRLQQLGALDLGEAPTDRVIVVSALDRNVAEAVDDLRAAAESPLAIALQFPGAPRVAFPLEREEIVAAVSAAVVESGGEPPIWRLLSRLDEIAASARQFPEASEPDRPQPITTLIDELRTLVALLPRLEHEHVAAADEEPERALAEVIEEAEATAAELSSLRVREESLAAARAVVASNLAARPRLAAHDEDGWSLYLERAEELAVSRSAAEALERSVEEEELRLGEAGVDLVTALDGATRLERQGNDARHELRGRLESQDRYRQAVAEAGAIVQVAATELERHEGVTSRAAVRDLAIRRALIGIAGASGAATLFLWPWVTGGICVASLGAALLRRDSDSAPAERSVRDPLTDAQQKLASAEQTRADSEAALRSRLEAAGFSSVEELEQAFEHHGRLRELVELRERQAAASARLEELETETAPIPEADAASPVREANDPGPAERLEDVRLYLQLLRKQRRLERERAAAEADRVLVDERRKRLSGTLRARIAFLARGPLDAARRGLRAHRAEAAVHTRQELRAQTARCAHEALTAALVVRRDLTLEPARRRLAEWCEDRFPELSTAAADALTPEPAKGRGGADLLAVLALVTLAPTLAGGQSLAPLVLEDSLGLLDDRALTAALALLAERVAPERQVLLVTSQPERLRQLGADHCWCPG